MTSETLRSISLDILGNYRRTAKSASETFRSSSARGFAQLNERVTALISSCEALLNGAAKRSVDRVQERATAVLESAADGVGHFGKNVMGSLGGTQHRMLSSANKADRMFDKILSNASRRLARRPAKNSRVGKLLHSDLALRAGNLGIGSARLVRRISAVVADGTERLSMQVAGSRTEVARRKRDSKRGRRVKRAGV
jgi:hypothetical protein